MWVLYPKTIIESINWVTSRWLYDFLNKINEKRFASKISGAISRLGFKDFIILDDNSMLIGYYLKELLKPDLFIYLLRDAVTLVSYHQKHGTILEPKLIAKSDLTVTNSEFFCEFARKYNPNSYMIGQGCDLSLYNDTDGSLQVPGDLKAIPRPIIGYTGALTAIRLDIEVLVHIAKSRPALSLVLVGPEDDKFIHSELHSLPNVFFLGRKNPEELPGYIKGFDVAINPQVINPITNVNYPLKIDEYLAMGKPVVATKTTFMAYFQDITYLAANKEEYVTRIDQALRENTPELEEKRKMVAKGHSWENFVGKIYDHASKLKK
jgi:glycosyltransferase involved in cell wall biosynthesis